MILQSSWKHTEERRAGTSQSGSSKRPLTLKSCGAFRLVRDIRSLAMAPSEACRGYETLSARAPTSARSLGRATCSSNKRTLSLRPQASQHRFKSSLPIAFFASLICVFALSTSIFYLLAPCCSLSTIRQQLHALAKPTRLLAT